MMRSWWGFRRRIRRRYCCAIDTTRGVASFRAGAHYNQQGFLDLLAALVRVLSVVEVGPGDPFRIHWPE